MYKVKRQELFKLPAGTVYSRWKPLCMGSLEVIEDIWNESHDFIYTMLHTPDLEDRQDDPSDSLRSLDDGEHIPAFFEWTNRDGRFDDDEEFIVWEKQDVERLVMVLQESLSKAY